MGKKERDLDGLYEPGRVEKIMERAYWLYVRITGPLRNFVFRFGWKSVKDENDKTGWVPQEVIDRYEAGKKYKSD